ncbi:hypothetical protein B2G51_13165 [Leptospira santarosai]|nr:hypothetical protein B2G51_13165 [Leptospira santarosai]
MFTEGRGGVRSKLDNFTGDSCIVGIEISSSYHIVRKFVFGDGREADLFYHCGVGKQSFYKASNLVLWAV